MRAFRLTDVKGTMNHLLARETFDEFLISEAEIFSGVTLTLDGHLRNDFYTEEEYAAYKEHGEFLPYGEVRKILYETIRGQHTPSSMHLVFVAPREMRDRILSGTGTGQDAIGGLYLNLRFNAEGLTLVTGVSMENFSLDRSGEEAWDRFVPSYFEDLGIPMEES